MAAIRLGLRRFQLVALNACVSGTSRMVPEFFLFFSGVSGCSGSRICTRDHCTHARYRVSYTPLETWVEGALLSVQQNRLRHHEDVSMSGGQGS